MEAGYSSASFVHLNRGGADSGWHRDRGRAFAELKVNLIAFSDSVFDLQGRCTSTAFDKGQDVYASHGQPANHPS